MIHFVSKKELAENDKKIKKYYFLGCLYLRKEESLFEKNTKLLGIRISHHKLMEKCIVNTLAVPSLFNTQHIIKKEIDIIIPVYNGYEYLDNLFESIQKNTDLPYNLYVVNDCSSDERVLPLLMKWKNTFQDSMVIIHNETNLGFVKSVNAALKQTKHDVVLVNTDVILPAAWASRLLYPVFSDENVASVTPFSNAATIFSLPAIGDNDFDGDLEKVNDALSKFNTPYQALQVPTGVGFCMAMSRKAIDKTGLLDEMYGRGYGEENDWCQRAIKAGFYHAIAGNVFVWHKHGGSFITDEKKALIEQHTQILLKKFPHYLKDVRKTVQNETFLSFRFLAELFYLSSLSGSVQVWFDHFLGGGSEVYLRRQVNALKNEHLFVLVQNKDCSDLFKMSYCYKEYTNQILIRKNDVLTILEHLSVQLIGINNLAKYQNVLEMLGSIAELKKKTGAKVSFRGHDLFCICPTVNMLNTENIYCACEDISVCEKCLLSNKNSEINRLNIHEWRSAWQNFFAQAVDEAVVFSQSTFDLYAKYYPETVKLMTIIPHAVPALRKVNIAPHSGLNIILLGNIHINKGYLILKKMADLLKEYPDVQITVVGTVLKPLKQIEVTGSYQVNDLPEIMEKYLADIIFIPSVWPETFSYTTSEVISMDLPVACFDLGAPAERIKKYEKGLIVSKIDAETAIKEIIDFCHKLR